MSDNSKPPIIQTDHGPTTEWCRKLAAANMRADADVMKRVIDLIGEEKARRDFPEAFE